MLDDPDQRAVILGLRNGQRDAWAALYDGYSVDVWRYVARLVGGSTTDVADIVQETFLSAARSAHQFDADRGTLWSWLSGIAHHQTAAYWRQINRQSKLRKLAESNAEELRRWTEVESDDQKSWEQRECSELVRATLASLTPDYAAALVAKYLDDESLEEMARQFGGTVEATKSRLARARREFRSQFERISRDPVPVFDELSGT